MKRDLVRSTLLAVRIVLLSYLAAACSVSQFQSTSTVPVGVAAPIPHAIVHIVGGTTSYRLSDVIVLADSVVGFDEVSGARLAIPEASVGLVETQSVSPAKTVQDVGIVVLGTIVLLGALLSYIVRHSRID